MNFTELKQKINNNNRVEFGSVFNRSIELFKKVWLQGLIQYLLTVVLAIPIIIVLYVPMFFIAVPLGLMNENMEFNEDLSLSIGIVAGILLFVLYVLAMVLMLSVQLVIRAAFYKICKDKDFNPKASSDEYFIYFKKKYLKKIIILSFITIGAVLLGLLCFVIPALILSIPLFYLPVVFAFNPELSPKEIFRISLNLGMKKWWITLLLIIVASLLATFVGMLACLIGIYVTMSFVYLPAYYIYKDVIGFDEEPMSYQEIEIK